MGLIWQSPTESFEQWMLIAWQRSLKNSEVYWQPWSEWWMTLTTPLPGATRVSPHRCSPAMACARPGLIGPDFAQIVHRHLTSRKNVDSLVRLASTAARIICPNLGIATVRRCFHEYFVVARGGQQHKEALAAGGCRSGRRGARVGRWMRYLLLTWVAAACRNGT
jgi:hypothetical protein